MRTLKGFIVLVAAVLGGISMALVVSTLAQALTGNEKIVGAATTAVFIFTNLTLLAYLSLWLSTPEGIAGTRSSTTNWGRWRAQKREDKLQAAELRWGAVYGFVGGGATSLATESTLLITLVSIGCALVGGLIGFDIKRRVLYARAQLAAKQMSETQSTPHG